MKRMLVGTMLLCAVFLAAPPTQAQTAAPARVVVHLTHATDNLHATFMALELARAMQEKGMQVTLLLDLEGVRVADTRQPNDLLWGHGKTLASHYDAFGKAGGKVLVCPHCAGAAGLDAKSLRPGARIAKDAGELADALIAADKILDY
jgi:predicted peroxiredoxin